MQAGSTPPKGEAIHREPEAVRRVPFRNRRGTREAVISRTLSSILRAQGRLEKLTPVAIIDIGSNSVRLVVYEGLSRSPTVLFNEKVLCGLGSGLAESGELNPTGVERALAALRRFRALAEQTQCDAIHTLATAAAREASNGPAFVKEAERILGARIDVLTGREEAFYAALGIVCGVTRPEGIVGDLGGGSLEYCEIEGRDVEKGRTVPLGGLRLADESQGSLERAREIAREHMGGDKILRRGKGGTFYAVGGTWRALGRLHMERTDYPLHVMHEYTIPAEEAAALCAVLAEGRDAGSDGVRGLDAVSSKRRDLLPYGAVVLDELMRVMKPERIVFSALGVREGFLYSRLPRDVQKDDPLLVAAEEFAVLRARSPVHARELARWSGEAFAALGYDETRDEKRWRKAACLLADISWRSHPEYRGDQALNIISNGAFVGVGHEGRAYLALANYYRHEGVQDDDVSPDLIQVAGPRVRERARLLGALMRVAYLFSGSMPGVVPRLNLVREGDGARLLVPPDLAKFEGERLTKRISALGNLIGAEMTFEVEAEAAPARRRASG